MRRSALTLVIAVLASLAVSGVGFAVSTTTLHQPVAVAAGTLNVAYRGVSPTLTPSPSAPYVTCSAQLVNPSSSGGFYFSTKLTFSMSNLSPSDSCGYNGFGSGLGFGYSGDTRVLAIVDLGSVQGTLSTSLTSCYVNGAPTAVQEFDGLPIQCGDFVFLDAVMLNSPVQVGPSTPFGYGAIVASVGALGGSVSSAFPGESVHFDATTQATPFLG